MKNSLRIGKLFGIDIGLDYSWFIIFIMVTWSLTGHYFPMHYKWPVAMYLFAGVTTSLLFFASVVAHELGHSFVAIRKGLPVRSITLFIFGGIARIGKEPERPHDEFWIAIAGPFVSAVLGLLFLGLSLFASTVSEPVTAVAGWLGTINLTLAVFNLVPGFPLDGGRILRSIVWGITGSFQKATKVASTAGEVIAYGLIILGVASFFSGQAVNGIWLVFLGWFLKTAAISSYEQVALQQQLSGVKASSVMMTDCPRLPRDMTLQTLVSDYILRDARRCFPVSENGSVYGIITLPDVKTVPRNMWPLTTVSQAMVPFEQTKKVQPDMDLFKVMELMAAEDINQVPVVENERFLGMISRDRLLNFIAAQNDLAA